MIPRVPLPAYLTLEERESELNAYLGIFSNIPWKSRINRMRKQFMPESSVFVGQLHEATPFFFAVVGWLCGGPSGPNAVLATGFPDFLVQQMEQKYEDHPWKRIVLNFVMSSIDTVWDRIGPVPWDAVAEKILLSPHFSHCHAMNCRPPSNVLHRESITVVPLTEDARDLVSKRPYHMMQCLNERHFNIENIPIVEDTDRFVLTFYVHFLSDGTQELLVCYRLPIPQNFYGMEQVYPLLNGKRIHPQYNDAIGLRDFYNGSIPKTYTKADDQAIEENVCVWQRRLFPVAEMKSLPLREIRTNLGKYAPNVRSLTYLDILPHQLNTIAWMISHSEVPLWQWVGTLCRNTYICPHVHRHSTVHLGRKPSNIYGGCLISSPNTGKTLCVLLYICMSPRKCLIVTSRSMIRTWRDQAQRFLRKRDCIRICTHEQAPEFMHECEEVIFDSVGSLDTRSRIFHGLVNMPQRYRWVVQSCDDIKPLMRLLHLDAAVPGVSLGLFQNHSLEGYICRRQLCLQFYAEQCLTVSNDKKVTVHVPNTAEWERIQSKQLAFSDAVFQSKMKCKWDSLFSNLYEHKIPSSLILSGDKNSPVWYDKTRELPCEPLFINKNLTCCVCYSDSLILQSQCGHTICSNCYESLATNLCPVCRENVLFIGTAFDLDANDLSSILYESCARYVHSKRTQKWLVVGKAEIASAFVQIGLPVLVVPEDGQEIVSSATRKDGIVYVWNRHPEGVYLGAFTDILFCNWERRYFQRIGKGSGIYLHYFFFKNSIQDFMYKYNIEKGSKSVIRDWVVENTIGKI